jgi:hypothetical protein
MPQTTTFLDDAILPLGDKDAPPLALTDIYMDDMCLLAQHTHLARMLNTVLHNIEKVFKDPTNSPRRHVVSHSKITKGDATWSTKKRLLGWDIDSGSLTLSIPPHRHEK